MSFVICSQCLFNIYYLAETKKGKNKLKNESGQVGTHTIEVLEYVWILWEK